MSKITEIRNLLSTIFVAKANLFENEYDNYVNFEMKPDYK